MTSLVGASVLLIAASSLALIFGWVTADESLIWISIAASVASGVALALAYGRARQELRRPAGSMLARAEEAIPADSSPVETEVAEVTELSAPEREEVVIGVPHSKRFHMPTCRYANAKSAIEITKSDALGRGFRPCGICKP